MADPLLPGAAPSTPVPTSAAGAVPTPGGESGPAPDPAPERRERKPAPLGRIALLLSVVMVALVVVAIQVDAPGHYLAATVLAYAAITVSAAAVVLGLVAAIRGRQRGVAIAALVIAVLGDPLVLLYGLGALT